MAAPSVVAVGDVMLDVTVAPRPAPGERVHGEVRVRAGGSATIAAIAAAAAGAAATLVGRVGSDVAGTLIESEVERLGVRPLLARDPRAQTGAVAAVGGGVVAEPGASALLEPGDVPQPLEADAVLVSGYALLQRPSEAGARAALDRAVADWVAVDAASPRLLEAFTPPRFFAATTRANAIVATDAEARVLTGEEGESAARALGTRYRLACVKHGAAGATAVLDGELEVATAQPVEDRDPLGAGDAFAGALLAALARGTRLLSALGGACEAGARWSAATNR